MATVNPKSIIASISKSARLVALATQKARREHFNPAVQQMLADFDSDLITKEILGGVDAENISNTLPNSRSSNMNLYSFIGFSSDEPNPIIELRKMINPRTNLGKEFGPKIEYLRGSRTNEGEYQFRITQPDKAAIFAATPLPWANGISWAYRIEQGIPGIGKFLNTDKFESPDPSRSGGGLQVENQLRGGSFKNRSYLSKIFRNFLSNAKKGAGNF